MADRIRIIRIIPKAFPTAVVSRSASLTVARANGSIGTTIPVAFRAPERWIGIKRGKPHAPLRAPSAPSRNTSAHCAMAAAGFAKSTPTGHGKGRTPAPVARPAPPALTATAPTTNRRGYRKASSLMLKARRPAGVGGNEWQGPCRPAMLRYRPDEPTAGKPDGS
jgi:hypothetical protein